MLNGIVALHGTGVPPVTSSYESIATVNVDTSLPTTVEFTSIPSTYKHLQIRAFVLGTRSDYQIGEAIMRFNNDTGTNYSAHFLVGDGSGTGGGAQSNSTSIPTGDGTFGGNAGGGGNFGVMVMDIFDYADTNKYKTVRHLSGVDLNGTYNTIGGRIDMMSGSWRSTSAISSIKFTAQGISSFRQYTQFALYGIKG